MGYDAESGWSDAGGSDYSGGSLNTGGQGQTNIGQSYSPGEQEVNSTTSNPTTTTQTSTVIGVSSQTFRVTCKGLRPNTKHTPYLVNKDVSADCAPIVSGSPTATYTLGASLVSDSSGTLIFDYSFKPEDSPYETKYISSVGQTIAIIPYGQQAFRVASADGMSTAQSYIESKQPS